MVRAAVDKSDVLVAVIGLRWLTLTAANGGRRIDQPGDWVAEEIGTALRRGTLVIPVLVDGAQMPSRDELPPALADLANRQALKIAHESFAADSRRLIETIEEMVSAATPETVNLWDDPDYPQARGAFLQGLWPAAIEGLERVLHRHPRQPHVVEQLEQARRSQHLLDLDATAESAADAGRWQEVVDALKAIDALQPSDDVKDRLAMPSSASGSMSCKTMYAHSPRPELEGGAGRRRRARQARPRRPTPTAWPPRRAPSCLRRNLLPATPEPSAA